VVVEFLNQMEPMVLPILVMVLAVALTLLEMVGRA
jgi:hypothetical protein